MQFYLIKQFANLFLRLAVAVLFFSILNPLSIVFAASSSYPSAEPLKLILIGPVLEDPRDAEKKYYTHAVQIMKVLSEDKTAINDRAGYFKKVDNRFSEIVHIPFNSDPEKIKKWQAAKKFKRDQDELSFALESTNNEADNLEIAFRISSHKKNIYIEGYKSVKLSNSERSSEFFKVINIHSDIDSYEDLYRTIKFVILAPLKQYNHMNRLKVMPVTVKKGEGIYEIVKFQNSTSIDKVFKQNITHDYYDLAILLGLVSEDEDDFFSDKLVETTASKAKEFCGSIGMQFPDLASLRDLKLDSFTQEGFFALDESSTMTYKALSKQRGEFICSDGVVNISGRVKVNAKIDNK